MGAQHRHLDGITDRSTVETARAPAGVQPERLPTVDDPRDTQGRARPSGPRLWRRARTAGLLAALGLLGVLTVEPPAALNFLSGEAAAAPHVPAADRWIALGTDPSTTSDALHAIQTLVNDKSLHKQSADDRIRHKQSVVDRTHHKQSAADSRSRRSRQAGNRNSRTHAARGSDSLRSRSHSHSRTNPTPRPTSRLARTSARQPAS